MTAQEARLKTVLHQYSIVNSIIESRINSGVSYCNINSPLFKEVLDAYKNLGYAIRNTPELKDVYHIISWTEAI